MRFGIFNKFLILGNICFGSTTASTDYIHQSFIDIFLDFGSHFFGCLVVLPQTIRKSGIRVSTYIIRSTTGQLLQERFQLSGTKRAVQSDGKDISMLYRSQKRIKRLSRQRASSNIRNRNRKHQRNFSSQILHSCFCGQNSSFRIQCIENCFYQNSIYSPFKQSLHLFTVSFRKFIECQCTKSGIIYIRTHRASFVGRSYRTSNKAWLFGSSRCIFISNFTGQTSCRKIYLTAISLHMIICHRNSSCIKCICFDDISSCL